MDIESLRLFREVVARGSFTDAARRCYMSQQALSRKVSAMEAELGQRLLNRTTPLSPTPAGRVVLREANAMLAAYDRMTRSLERIRTRTPATVRVRSYGTGSYAGLFAGLLERLAVSNPEIDVQFVRTNEDDLALLRDGRIDVGFVRTVAVDDVEAYRPDDACDYLPLASDAAPLLFGVSEGHPLAGCGRVTLGQLAEYPLAMPTDTSLGALPLAVRRLFEEQGLHPATEDVWCSSASEHFFEFFSGMGEDSVAFFTGWSFDDFVPNGRLGTRRLVRLEPGPQRFEVRGYAVTMRSCEDAAVRTVLDAMRAVDEELARGAA